MRGGFFCLVNINILITQDYTYDHQLCRSCLNTFILWQETGHCIAIKTLQRPRKEGDDNVMDRWQTEVEILMKLDHRNVVKGFEVPAELQAYFGSTPYVAMQYCSGGDLRQVLHVHKIITNIFITIPTNQYGTTTKLRSRSPQKIVTNIHFPPEPNASGMTSRR